MEFPTILAIFFILFAFTRVVTVIIHELGHALAGLILFKGQISIYVGSYGDPQKGIHFNIARLKIHFKYNPLLWNHGLCTSKSTQMTFVQGYVFTLAGPLASLLVSIACLYILITPESHGALKLVCLFLFLSSIVDFFQNICPNKKPIMLHDGTLTYNDGHSLRLLREYRDVYKEITLLSQYYTNNEIETGISFFENEYSKKPDPNIFRLGIALTMKGEYFKKAVDMFTEFSAKYELNAEDYCNYALAYSYLGQHQIALDLYERSLNLNAQAFYSLNNRGYTLNILERYEEAITDFNKALELNPNFAYAYNNRGLSKIKLGDIQDGLNDIEKSIEIDDKNSYAYKNLGIYHKDKGEHSEAMKLFSKAKHLDPKTDGLYQLMEETAMEIKADNK